MAWGDRWLSPDGPPMEVRHKDCGEVTRPVVACEHCHGELTRRNVQVGRGARWRPPAGVTLPAGV